VDNKKTLYISDLDGTLLNSSVELSRFTTDTLNEMIMAGLYFTIATARTFATVGKIVADLTMKNPIVLMNGVLIYNVEQKRYIKVNRLPSDTVIAVTRILRMFEVTGFMYELKNGEQMTYYESLEQKPLRDFVEERVARYNKVFRQIDSFEYASPEHVIYFSLLDKHERLQPVYEALAAQPGLGLTMYKDIYSPDLWYLEMFSSDASKRNAVVYLREEYGFDRIIGFGDNLNDLPMFTACDVSVAVENANPEVRAAASHICGKNEDDGVAKWLKENAV